MTTSFVGCRVFGYIAFSSPSHSYLSDLPYHWCAPVQTVFGNLMAEFQRAVWPTASALDHASINYLAVSKHHSQPLCGNSEGWGPLSPFRYDFTPCFLDVWVASVAAFGIVFGAGAVYYLLRKCTPQPIKKDWHFWAKMVCSMLMKSGCSAFEDLH